MTLPFRISLFITEFFNEVGTFLYEPNVNYAVTFSYRIGYKNVTTKSQLSSEQEHIIRSFTKYTTREINKNM